MAIRVSLLWSILALIIGDCTCNYVSRVEIQQLERKVEDLEARLANELEEGGKRFQTVPCNGCNFFDSEILLRDHDYLRLQFMGARNAWFACWLNTGGCKYLPFPSWHDSQGCPNYVDFTSCDGEVFQIIGDGVVHGYIRSGQRVRIYFPLDHMWVGCEMDTCNIRTCPGSITQSYDFNKCDHEVFKIYARGRKDGEAIHNGDVVMFSTHGHYLTIPGRKANGNDAYLDYCPGVAPPTYLSYGTCSKSAFRIYRKP